MLDVRPLTPDIWDDLVAVFGGGKGDCGRCWCMYWHVSNKAFVDGLGEINKARLKRRVSAGPPPGLLGYDEAGEPVGWVQVGPRADMANWNRAGRLTAPIAPADATDARIWGVSCFVIRVGFRGRGHFSGLLDGAIDWARRNGAAALDACPVDTDGRRPATALYHGVARAFQERGFVELTRRRPDRPLMRLKL